MKNKKGEITTGLILMTFLSIIVGLVLLTGSFDFLGQATNTFYLSNQTYTAPAVSSTIDLYGQELIDTPVVYNRSNMTAGAIASGNYTIAERVSTIDGVKRISYTSNAGSVFAGQPINVSYTYGHLGYIDSAGGRSIADLIPIFAAIALIVAALALIAREKFF